MYIFIIVKNKLKISESFLGKNSLEIYPIYFVEMDNEKTDYHNFLNHIFDTVSNELRIYRKIPPTFNYFIFKHPNIQEVEEEYAKEAASLFNLDLTYFKKGWAIKVPSIKNDSLIQEFSFKNFANPLLDIFFPYKEFNIEKITKLLPHKLELPKINNISFLKEFYNLSKDELNIIFQEYIHRFGRNPNILEIGTFAQYWSEHCRHKTINGTYYIDGRLVFSNLLNETIFYVTKKLKKKWCVSVFKDNSGVIAIDDKSCICAKVETHNHPSSIEPYSGAATGIGGVIRDIIATGKGAKPICSLDAFFVGNIYKNSKQYNNILWKPINLLKNLVLGVRDYGNRMGIPTTAGCVYFDDSYLFNPLVFCGTIGIIDKNKVKKEVKPGDYIILIGGRTGRDGLHGASFSSGKITKEEFNKAINSVQLPNPIVEKKIEQFILRTTKENIIESITDCGAGGISVATLEIIQHYGAMIELNTVKTKYSGLSEYEIWLSESQERVIVIIDRKNLKRFIKIAQEEEVEFSILGNVTNIPICTIHYNGKIIAKFHKMTLDRKLPTKTFYLNSYDTIKPIPVDFSLCESYSSIVDSILKIISNPITSSKESIIRQYDHEVGGRTILKPIADRISSSDGCILKLFYDKDIGVGIGIGHKVEIMKVDTYEGAIQSVDEAVRNLISMGGNPEKIALLDNFCWGDAQDSDQLYRLVRASQACKDIAIVYKMPFISGKDSFNNYFVSDTGKKINITPTLLITAVCIIDNINKIPSKIFLSPNSSIYYIGPNQFLLGCSLFYKLHGYTGKFYPKLKAKEAIKLYKMLHRAITDGIISSIHDISEGGIACAVVEMFLDSQYGVTLDLDNNIKSKNSEKDYKETLNEILFSEPPSSFIVEVKNKYCKKFENYFKNFFYMKIGEVTNDKNFTLKSAFASTVISKSKIKKYYTNPLKNLYS